MLHDTANQIEEEIIIAQIIPVVQPLRVLVVDDSPYNLFVLQELIGQIDPGIVLETAMNGKEALERVADALKRGDGCQGEEGKAGEDIRGNTSLLKPYDVIFLDIHMPVMDGYQTA